MANKIRDYRSSKSITQQQLAEATNVSQQAVAKWESGDVEVGLRYVPLIAKALGVRKELIFPELAEDSEPRNLTPPGRLYPPDKVPIPLEVQHAAALGKLAFFVGNGISRLYGLPSWEELCTRMLNTLAAKGIVNHNEIALLSKQPLKTRISIADHHFKRFKDNGDADLTYRKVLLRELDSSYKNKVSAYSSLAKCGVKFVTTNYDGLLAEAVEGTVRVAETVKNSDINQNAPEASVVDKPQLKERATFSDPYKFSELALLNNNTVFHLHGSLEDESTIVASTTSYLKLYANENVQKFLHWFFENHIIVFIGYGLEELELLDLIIRTAHPELESGTPRRLFLLLPMLSHESEILEQLEIYYKQLNIEILPFSRDKKDYASYADLLEVWSGELTKVVRGPTRVEELKLLDSLIGEFEGDSE